MAKKKYFTSWDEMIIGIREDSSHIFDEVCEELCEEANDLLSYYIYEQKAEVPSYQRTYEMDGLISYKKIGALNAEFYYNEKLIETIDNPYHNVLEEGGTIEQMVDVASWGREEDIRAFIAKRFPQMYREKAKKLGLL
jgi:hypothetical protein